MLACAVCEVLASALGGFRNWGRGVPYWGRYSKASHYLGVYIRGPIFCLIPILAVRHAALSS